MLGASGRVEVERPFPQEPVLCGSVMGFKCRVCFIGRNGCAWYFFILHQQQGERHEDYDGRLGFSRPAFVGNALYVNEIFDSKYIIKRMSPGDTSPLLALKISDGSIIHAPVIHILVNDEVR
jgi:hypothetical protein